MGAEQRAKMTYQRNETPEPIASDPVEVGYKTHLAQYNCGRRLRAAGCLLLMKAR